jgi:hypothetical protein
MTINPGARLDPSGSRTPGAGGFGGRTIRDLAKVGKQARAASVQVGRFSATMILQDPSDPAGVRPFGLYWSDGGRDMYIRAAAPSNHLVDFARARGTSRASASRCPCSGHSTTWSRRTEFLSSTPTAERRSSLTTTKLKFHLTRRNRIKGTDLIDPAFIYADRYSLLERAHDAVVGPDGDGRRLTLVTPWDVADDDPLARLVERNGALDVDELFTGGPRSSMGRLRVSSGSARMLRTQQRRRSSRPRPPPRNAIRACELPLLGCSDGRQQSEHSR